VRADRLTPGDQIVALSAIVLFLVSFVHWLGATVSLASGQAPIGLSLQSSAASAWSFTLPVLAVLLGLALLAYVLLKAGGVQLIGGPEGTLTVAQLVLCVALTAFVFVLAKLLAGPHLSGFPTTVSGHAVQVHKSRKVGIYLGLLATVGLVVGAVLNLQAAQLERS